MGSHFVALFQLCTVCILLWHRPQMYCNARNISHQISTDTGLIFSFPDFSQEEKGWLVRKLVKFVQVPKWYPVVRLILYKTAPSQQLDLLVDVFFL